jgi:hypothetical protein
VLDRRSFLLVLAAAVAAAVVLVPMIVSRDSSRQLSPDEYRLELADALDGFDRLDLTGADGLDEMADRFGSAGEAVAELNPPPDAAAANARLAAGLRSDGERMAEAADAGRAGEARYLMKLAEDGGSGWRWLEPFNELAAKGYTSWQGR